jgi:hypothetical protein
MGELRDIIEFKKQLAEREKEPVHAGRGQRIRRY